MNCMIFLKKNVSKFQEKRIKNGKKYNTNRLRLEYHESGEQPNELPDKNLISNQILKTYLIYKVKN